MYRTINRNTDAVLDRLRGDVPRVRELDELRALVDGAGDPAFQKKYRRYWGMNAARLGPDFYDEYFALLEQSRSSRLPKLETIARRLAKVSGNASGPKLHFSFASKLLHTIDPHAPVYDSLVAAFYFFVPPVGGTLEEKLRPRLTFYDFLVAEYARVLREQLLDPAIRRFRKEYDHQQSFTDERVVDLLLWSFVRLLRDGAQRENRLLYE